MKICRKLFVVIMANNDHGKTTIIKSFVSQGTGRIYQRFKKSQKTLTSPSGREISSYIFGRSYQEMERGPHGSTDAALSANDPEWRTRELIVFPSHVAAGDLKDVEEMVRQAHKNGFDAIGVPVLLEGNGYSNRSQFETFLELNWDERWTLPNHAIDTGNISSLNGQLDALGRDLFWWVCATLTK